MTGLPHSAQFGRVTSVPPDRRWHTREESGIRLDRFGRWWHDDELIEHPRIIEAFNVGLSPTDDGRYRLTFGNDWCFVEVEDAAYSVRAVDVTPQEEVSIRLSDRTGELLDIPSLQLDPDGVLSCRVKQGRAKARFSRESQFALGSLLDEKDGGLILRAGSREVPVSLAPK